ncbi:hypothetical protein RCO22_10530 [Pseudomonas yamanorum]|uniref:Uncharacterized protein n=1 Tax=Pseudomonas yamanorum TaxID=515393 RepID=A0ABU1CQ29_9PSED|nr:hypothetical protein [Pseudomonas yamanorum]MDR0189374.1 hypothetical protein [Pseudomonas yamanorum]
MRQFDLTCGFRPDVLELKLPDADGQRWVTVYGCFYSSLLSRIVPPIAQHLLAHSKP